MSAMPNFKRIDAAAAKLDAAQTAGPLGRLDQADVAHDNTVLLEPPDFSDDRLALDFVRAYGAGHRWSPGLGWMTDTGIVWKRDDILGLSLIHI